MSIPNGVRLTFGTPLPAGLSYRIVGRFYVPEAGNKDVEGKQTLIGPGLLVNGNAAENSYKHPNSVDGAGVVQYDTWMQVEFLTQAFPDELEYLDFRFYTNDFATHPEVWYLDNLSIESFDAEAVVIEVEDLPGLKDVYKDYFVVGTTGNARALTGVRFELINKHFNSFTHENELKPLSVQYNEGVFTFDSSDEMTAILLENGFTVVGHTLVWHSQSPHWFFEDQTREQAQERLETHIKTVMRHAGLDLIAMDVVNEAFKNSTDGSDWRDGLREEGWIQVLGPDFIEIAFRAADEARQEIGRPDLKLYYNDFNLDEAGKSTDVYNMVTELREKGVPIDGIGMQAHYSQNTSPANVKRSLELFATIPGIEVSVTELDITIQSSQGNLSLTAAEELQQGALYAQLFALYKEYAMGPANPDPSKRLIPRVTIWGTTDDVSWRGDRNPLLFDRTFKAKGAYYAAADPEGYMEQHGIVNVNAPRQIPKASAVRGTPAIDAEMDDLWLEAQEIAIDRPVASGPVNATAKARTMWDDEYLYVWIEVTDPILDEGSQNEWEQDSVEVFVSEQNHGNASYTSGDGQYRVSVSNHQSFNARNRGEGFQSAAKVTDNGYIIELAVKLYEVTPAIGNVVGFDIQINDGTDGRRTALAIWSDLTGMGYTDASNWGELTLLETLPQEEPEPEPEATEEPPAATPTPTEPPAEESGGFGGWVWLIVGAVAVAAATIAVFTITKKKKK
jgi:endo-1,4-beta-xylanase